MTIEFEINRFMFLKKKCYRKWSISSSRRSNAAFSVIFSKLENFMHTESRQIVQGMGGNCCNPRFHRGSNSCWLHYCFSGSQTSHGRMDCYWMLRVAREVVSAVIAKFIYLNILRAFIENNKPGTSQIAKGILIVLGLHLQYLWVSCII